MPKISDPSRATRARTIPPRRRSIWLPLFGFVLVAGVVVGLASLRGSVFFASPLPLCPDCYSNSLRDPIDQLAKLWEEPPQSVEAIGAELTLLETAYQIQLSTNSTQAERESTCLASIVERFDLRLNDYANHCIEDLVGFGPDEACPRIEGLLKICDRLQALMNHSSKGSPLCREPLDWHSRQYSCSAGQH